MQINFWKQIVGCGILFLIGNCKTVPFQPESYRDDYLVIGNGGGYTGIETSFYITTNGDVFRHSGRDTIFQKMPRINQKIVKQAIGSIDQLNLIDYQFQNPGNVYKFLSMNIEGKSNKVVWGDNQQEVSPAIANIYRLLNQSLQNDK